MNHGRVEIREKKESRVGYEDSGGGDKGMRGTQAEVERVEATPATVYGVALANLVGIAVTDAHGQRATEATRLHVLSAFTRKPLSPSRQHVHNGSYIVRNTWIAPRICVPEQAVGAAVNRMH